MPGRRDTLLLLIPYIARWDLDKTYLRTEFDTLRDLLRTAFEGPRRKKTVPGASTLLREIAATGASIHILSGSPEQLRAKLEEKLRLDGARWDTFTLKPNLRNVLRLGFARCATSWGTSCRRSSPRGPSSRRHAGRRRARERVLIGDDAESDALVYSLYADVIAGAVADAELEDLLTRAQATRTRSPTPCATRDILEHDGRRANPDSPRRPALPAISPLTGPRVVPFYNYLQAAFVLEEDGRLTPRRSYASPSIWCSIIVSTARHSDVATSTSGDGDTCAERDPWQSASASTTWKQIAPLPAAREIEQMCKTLAEVARPYRKGHGPHGSARLPRTTRAATAKTAPVRIVETARGNSPRNPGVVAR